ncbi:Protein vip1 [Yarrowia sp. C11]|nr:Protein vip1 [Yarrowia sp. E02]KAG5373359.1 Protein vip1 [Yarrowia sp. C11]
MSYNITAKGVSPTTSKAEIKKYFSFCGKVKSVTVDEETHTATITFANLEAVRTALLIADGQIGDSKVSIEVDDATLKQLDEPRAVVEPKDEKKAASTEEEADGAQTPDSISQELKPRAAILAEMLSNGYVLSDKVLERAIDYDKEHGITSKFTAYLTDLDKKYHVVDKAQATDQAYGITARLQKYWEDALNTTYGRKIREYYSEAAKEASDIHAEARRLADLKEQELAKQAEESKDKITDVTEELKEKAEATEKA